MIFSVTFVLGPILAGLLVASAGAAAALFVDVGSFAISGTMLLDLHPHVEEAGGESVRARVRAAWRYVRGERALLILLVAQGVGLIFFESAVPIEVAYVKRTLVAGDGGYGLLVTAWGVGVVLGSVIFARAGTRSLTVLLVGGTLAIGCGYIGFAIAPTLALAALAAVVGGIGNGVQYAPVISGVQRLTPPSLQGRVMGLLESISAVTPAIGTRARRRARGVGSPRFAFAVVGGGRRADRRGVRPRALRQPGAGAARRREVAVLSSARSRHADERRRVFPAPARPGGLHDLPLKYRRSVGR